MTFSLAGAERIALVGDSHANLLWMIRSLRLVSKSGISHVVVLGDFGYWPRMTLGREVIDAVAAEATTKTTRHCTLHNTNPGVQASSKSFQVCTTFAEEHACTSTRMRSPSAVGPSASTVHIENPALIGFQKRR